MCQKPYKQGVLEYGCSQCMPCRINRRRVWTARLLLESLLHEECCFLTLTYNEENYPKDGSLSVRDYQLFLKRLRKSIQPKKIRYYICGEYGDSTERPHYHAVLFGFGVYDDYLQLSKLGKRNYYTEHGIILLRAWNKGNIHVGEVNEQSIAYGLKHLTKGMKNNDKRLDGRYPEFARMSLRPGIGAGAMASFADWLVSDAGSKYIATNADIVGTFRHYGHIYSIGRYLKQTLRKECGMDGKTPQRAIYNASMKKLEELNLISFDDVKNRRISDGRKAKFQYLRQKAKGVL